MRWSCLGVSCPKFEILPKSSDQVDMKLTYLMRRDTRASKKYELGRYLSSMHWPFLEDVESCEVKLQLLVDLITVGVDTIMPLKRIKLLVI